MRSKASSIDSNPRAFLGHPWSMCSLAAVAVDRNPSIAKEMRRGSVSFLPSQKATVRKRLAGSRRPPSCVGSTRPERIAAMNWRQSARQTRELDHPGRSRSWQGGREGHGEAPRHEGRGGPREAGQGRQPLPAAPPPRLAALPHQSEEGWAGLVAP